MQTTDITTHAAQVIAAWNTQDVEAVVACYTDDLIYRDPNTRGAVEGADAFRRYLGKLFRAWSMHWSIREAFPFEDGTGTCVLWRASFRKPDGERRVDINGMDMAQVRGDLVSRNDVYFDRALLAPLMGLGAV